MGFVFRIKNSFPVQSSSVVMYCNSGPELQEQVCVCARAHARTHVCACASYIYTHIHIHKHILCLVCVCLTFVDVVLLGCNNYLRNYLTVSGLLILVCFN